MSETAAQLLPGQMVTALVAAAVLAYPLARCVLWRYERAVEAAMRSRSPPQAAASPPSAPLTTAWPPDVAASADTLLTRLRRAPWRAAAAQAAIAVLMALYFGVLRLLSAEVDISVYRVLTLAATHLWPGVLAVLMIAGISARQRVGVLVGGTVLYLLLGVWAHTGPPGKALVELGVLWALTNLPPSVYLLAFMTRRVRAVGPLVLLVTFTVTSGIVAVFAVLQASPAALDAVAGTLIGFGLSAFATMLVILIGAGALALLSAWWLLTCLARAYADYRIGDQGVALAAMWLCFVLIYSVDLASGDLRYFLCGLLGFPLYLALARGARGLLQPPTDLHAPALLLLRVFARRGPTTGLFHALSRYWRHQGPIRMIAGYDLASEAVEPDEMMAFLRRRLADHFITGPAVVARRLQAAPPRRDADGRYRSEEFFCFDDTWRDTLQRLVASSAVVLMDLRGFGPDNQGCIYELEALAKTGALSRAVLIHDRSTDMPTLRQALQAIAIDPASVHGIAVTGRDDHDIPALLAALSARVVRADGPSAPDDQ